MRLFIRSAYVYCLRGLCKVLKPTGVLDYLEKRPGRGARWLRSLFAIYDLDDLVSLDMPWWTFDAIDTVDAFLAARPKARVFEWGSGASTIWLSKRAAEVFSVEHDPDWAARVMQLTAPLEHVNLNTVAPNTQGNIASGKVGFEGQYFDDYVQAIHEVPGNFDLIVIDGRARESCLVEAISRLAPGGCILFDDFKRQRYQKAVAAQNLDIRLLDGLAACLPLPDSTALLSRAQSKG